MGNVIASQLEEKQIHSLRDKFSSLDVNGDGMLTAAEMREGMKKAGLPNIQDLEALFKELDVDGSGIIDYTEFLAACLDKKTYMQEDACWQAFRVFDKNGDGKISQQELAQVLGDDTVQQVAGNNLAN